MPLVSFCGFNAFGDLMERISDSFLYVVAGSIGDLPEGFRIF